VIDRTGKFNLAEQLWMQLSFNGIWILGAMAMSSWSLLWSLGYIVLFPVFGVLIGLMHLWVCPRCPHLKKCGSCVQMPPSLASRIIKKNVTGHLGVAEKVGFFVALYGVALAPLFWVIQSRSLLVPYLVLVLMHYSAYFLDFCKKCLNVHCPQNMARS
jgi:hypothetical protein